MAELKKLRLPEEHLAEKQKKKRKTAGKNTGPTVHGRHQIGNRHLNPFSQPKERQGSERKKAAD